jgi:hypothetical protein
MSPVVPLHGTFSKVMMLKIPPETTAGIEIDMKCFLDESSVIAS